MKNVTVPLLLALACIRPVVNNMLRLPYMSAEIAERLASRPVTMLVNGLETLSLEVLRDFEEAFSEWGIFDYAAGCALLGYQRRGDGVEDGSLMVRG